ncbi:SDR family NAD(P)-dependent oxidoreductase [Deinococcus sp. Arct2-2]|uniref:type I polyketide synthase n=1 Tax=Deinococcus sp. Arct2-2 TaxID=2568653 RepID=UPI0010A34B14|nr:type I polyketide synthase [Deinococcus sp. Arct2-2]THF70281.1 SDR family NAD(P)-dependent oxidoreductase [Deinococcus sp. Arct2-2]
MTNSKWTPSAFIPAVDGAGLAAEVAQPAEPIAIVGIGCRFPGQSNTPRQFWNFLVDGGDAVTEIPAERWRVDAYFNPDHRAPGRTYARWGGFIRDIDQFDAAFFGISPREAARMDPQQRLLLEVADEAFQDAGLPPSTLAGSDTGVFMGVSTCDYAGIQTASNARHSIDSFTNLGVGTCITANRISYHYDFHGPSFVVDTACSSSLVAVSLACKALWSRECAVALTGAVNLMLRPENTMGFSKAQMLSTQGRCKSFDADASGYVRAEGAGVLVLKPLSRAQADGDRIYAVIRAADINQDGRTGGIALPNGEAQAALLRGIYARAGLDPAGVRYVEAHGTGTVVGDPIEVNALGQVLRASYAPGQPECLIGSVKSNVGHLEAASGMAGLIKAALSIQQRELPGNLHFHTPNPAIPFDAYGLRVTVGRQAWPTDPDGSQSFLTGINSFGFGGTNAHVVLDSAPPMPDLQAKSVQPQSTQPQNRAEFMPLSARSPEALRAVAEQYRDFSAAHPDLPLSELAATLGRQREHHPYRLSLAPRSHPEWQEQLQAFLDGEMRAGMAQGRTVAEGERVPLAFVFAGMGPQWWAMGRELLGKGGEPVFRAALEEIDALLAVHTGWSLLAELTRPEEESRINETQIAQPAIFALQVALARLWASWGVLPDVIIGHSLGEAAAAHIAGALSLPDAVHLIYQRSRLQHSTAGQGKMLAVTLPPLEAAALVAEFPGRVSVAAINSPTDLTLAGVTADLETIAARLTAADVFNAFLKVDVPFHSPVMEQIRAEFFTVMGGLVPRAPTIPLMSTTFGRYVEGAELDVTAWWHNIRQSVLFEGGIGQMLQGGPHVFLEVSAHPALSASLTRCIAAAPQTHARTGSVVLPSLRRLEPERVTLLGSLGRLYTLGREMAWPRIHTAAPRHLPLPLYPWQHERHWNETARAHRERLGLKLHPLLGERQDSATPAWENVLDAYSTPDLRDHVVQGEVVFPGAGYVEMALAAARETFDESGAVLSDITFAEALILPPGEGRVVQTVVDARHALHVHSRPASAADAAGSDDAAEEDWTPHASATLRRLGGHLARQESLPMLRARCPRPYPTDAFYAQFHALGLQYGPHYRGLSEVWLGAGNGEALGMLRPALAHEDGLFPPPVLDACFQLLLGAVASLPDAPEGRLYLPVQIRELIFTPAADSSAPLAAHARLTHWDTARITGDLTLMDAAGNVLAEVRGLSCQAIDSAATGLDAMLYAHTWERQPLEPGQAAPLALTLPAQSGLEEIRADTLARIGTPQDRADFETLSARLAGLYARAALIGASESQSELKVAAQALADAVSGSTEIDPETLWRSLWSRFPGHAAELQVLHRAGSTVAARLQADRADPLAPISPSPTEISNLSALDGLSGPLDHLRSASPTVRPVHTLLASALTRLLDARNLDARTSPQLVRVLELNAARNGISGGLTAQLASALARPTVSLTLADADPDALDRAAARAGQSLTAVPETLLLDLARPLSEQWEGEQQRFDVVVGVDVGADAAANLRQLLAPGGVLLLERTQRLPAWTALLPELGTVSSPLADALTAAGFKAVQSLPDAPESELAVRELVWGRAPVADLAAIPTALNMTPAGRWLLFADEADFAAKLRAELEARQGTVQVVAPLGTHIPSAAEVAPADRAALTALLAQAGAFAGIIFAWGLNSPAAPSISDLQQTETIGGQSVLALVQALATTETHTALWLVTRGAQAVGGKGVTPMQAGLWGLGRVVGTEYPHLVPRLLDLDPAAPAAASAGVLVRELLGNSAEDEVAFREQEGQSVRWVHRLTRPSRDSLTASGSDVSANTATRIHIQRPGVLSSLVHQVTPRRAPAPGEVEVRVEAAALNFKDIMVGMGMLPDEALEGGFTGRSYGMEAAGIIERVGEGVTEYAPGDAVVLCGPDALSSFRTVPLPYVVRRPAHLSSEAAATLPIAYLTAYYALHTLCQLGPDDRVLIHAAAGGVGLAAIALCVRAGATVYATAGTPEKRELLRALGAAHVMDSRTLDFAEEVRAASGGRGVSIVLNSLSGEAIGRSLSCLSPYGKFVEIGKRDIYQNSPLDLAPFRNNLSYFAVDLDRMWVDRPQMMQGLLHTVMGLFESRELAPLAYRVFPYAAAESAFRFMAQARHTGKVVLALTAEAPAKLSHIPEPVHLGPDGVYLITGGLGGFGLALAGWLAGRGARRLVLVGRSAGSEAARASIDDLLQHTDGLQITLEQADIADPDAVEALLERTRQLGPLRGVFHAAMVIDDALIEQLTPGRYTRVTAPKVLGAWNLHTHTRADALDVFVCFSSVSALIGNLGQANYAAANAFLDTLADARRADGLPALTVNWGAVADVGYLTGQAAVAERLEAVGVTPVPVGQLLAALGELWPAALSRDPHAPGAVGVAALHWPLLVQSRGVPLPPRLAPLLSSATAEASSQEAGGFLSALLDLSEEERQTALSARLAEQLARILGTSPGKLDHDQAIMKMGVDSLMAVELGSQIQAETGVKVSPMKFVGGITLRGLTEFVLDSLTAPVPELQPMTLLTAPASNLAEHVETLPDADVDAMLAGLLAEQRGRA